MKSYPVSHAVLRSAACLVILSVLSGCGWLPRTLEFAQPPLLDGRTGSPALPELLKSSTGKRIKESLTSPQSDFDFGIVDLIDSSARLKDGKYEVLLVLKPMAACSLVGAEGVTLEQLVNAPEKRLALYQKGSLCGDVAPRAKLRQLGLKIPQTVYVTSPETALAMVANEIAALASTISHTASGAPTTGLQKTKTAKTVETPLDVDFPGFPVLVRKSLHSKIKAKIKNGLIELAGAKDHQGVLDAAWGGHELSEPTPDYTARLTAIVAP